MGHYRSFPPITNRALVPRAGRNPAPARPTGTLAQVRVVLVSRGDIQYSVALHVCMLAVWIAVVSGCDGISGTCLQLVDMDCDWSGSTILLDQIGNWPYLLDNGEWTSVPPLLLWG